MDDAEQIDDWSYINQHVPDWPQKVNGYEATLSFTVLGKSEEEALIRMRQFAEFVQLLSVDYNYESTSIAKFVVLDDPEPTITKVLWENEYSHPHELGGSMASAPTSEWATVRYNAPDGYDPREALSWLFEAYEECKADGEDGAFLADYPNRKGE